MGFGVGNVFAVTGVPFFHFSRPKLALDLNYEYENEKRTDPFKDRNDATDEYAAGVDIATDGWVYHPAFTKYLLRLSPEWRRRRSRFEGGRGETQNFALTEYFGKITFLQYKPYTFEIFGERERSTNKSSFAQKTDTDSDTYGASILLKYKILPTTLSYVHKESEQIGFFVSNEVQDEYRLDSYRKDANSNTHLNAFYLGFRRDVANGTTNTRDINSNLVNSYRFPSLRNSYLDSSLGVRWTKSNSIKDQRLFWDERFQWFHPRNFISNYRVGYENEKRVDFESNRYRASAGLAHTLYENLRSSIQGYGNRDDSNIGDQNIYGGRVSIEYRRSIPKGELFLGTSQEYFRTENDFIQDFQQVIDETHTLTTGILTLLINRLVDQSSLVITDTAGSTFYVEGVDYTISTVGLFTRISRTSFGGIVDGQTVFIDYRYLTNPQISFDTYEQGYNATLKMFKVLTFYYSLETTRYSVRSGIPTVGFENLRDQILGVSFEYIKEWSRTYLLYEENDSSTVPRITLLGRETLTYRPKKSLLLSITGEASKVRFKDLAETERLYGANGKAQWLIGQNLLFEGEGFYNKVSGPSETIEDTGVSSAIRYVRGIWRAGVKYTFVDENDKVIGERRRRHTIFAEIVRSLF